MAGSDALAPASGSGSALATASSSVAQGSADIEANRAGMKSALTDYAADKARIDAKEAALGDAPRLDALPKAPERQASNPIEAFGSAAMVLSVLGSTLTRQHLTAALNGATGVIGAYKQHDAEAADQKFQEWKVNTDNALKLHQYAMDTYKTSLDKLRDDRTGATAELNAKFKAFGDDNAAAVLQEQGAEGLSKLFLERDRQAADIGMRAQELGDKHKQVQQLFDLQADLKRGRELAASGDPAGAEVVRKAQQGIQDWATTQPGGIRAAVPNSPLARYIQMRADEKRARGEEYTADDEKTDVGNYNKDTAKPGAAPRSAGAAAVQKYIADNPGASAVDIQKFAAKGSAMSAAQRSLDAGPLGNQLRSLGVATDHLNTLRDLNDAFNGGDVKALSAAKAAWEREFGTPAPANMDVATQFVAPELIKAIEGSPGGVSERDELAKAFQSSKGHANVAGAIDTAFALMGGQLNGLRQQIVKVDKLANDDEFNDMLPSAAVDAMKKHATKSAPVEGGKADAPKQISTQPEYDALPSGAVYISTDGKPHRKP